METQVAGDQGIDGLSGRLWPFHMSPKDDELLSSWLVRLARAHSLRLHTFCDIAWPRRPIWNRDIDRSADEHVFEVLSEKTATPLVRVRQTTLGAYEGVFFERHDPNAITNWILPIGVYHRARRQFGLQFCPVCLRKDPDPFFRRHWRLAFVTMCSSHAVSLLDRCPQCGAAVAFHRLGIDATSITLCAACGFDLRRSRTSRISNAHSLCLVRAQRRWLMAERCGYVQVRTIGKVHSLLFFRGLRILVRAVHSRRSHEKRFLRIAKATRLLDSSSPDGLGSGIYFEHVELRARQRGLRLIANLLEKWPSRFLSLASRSRLTRAYVVADRSEVPYWLERSAFDAVRVGGRTISDTELEETRRFVSTNPNCRAAWLSDLKRLVRDAERKRRLKTRCASRREHTWTKTVQKNPG